MNQRKDKLRLPSVNGLKNAKFFYKYCNKQFKTISGAYTCKCNIKRRNNEKRGKRISN